MKRVLYRIFAFVLDLVLVSVVIFGLSSINFINPNIDEINYEYEKVSKTQETYLEFKDEIKNMVKDSRIIDEEYEKITTDYYEYIDLFDEVELNEDLTNSFIDSIDNEIDLKYQEIITKYNYKIQKLSVYENIIAIILYILYFGVLAYVLKGQTLFKKVFKLRTIDLKDESKKIPLWKYIVKAILICEIVILVTDIICVATFKESLYISASYWISQIKYIYEMAFIIVLIMRDDQRSIHDLLLNTKVVRYDKAGNIIEDQMFIKEEVVENTKKEIKEVNKTKKQPTKKTTKKKKEVVKAEKVNDKKSVDKTN